MVDIVILIIFALDFSLEIYVIGVIEDSGS